jgi:hypothetical protein
MNAFSRRSCRLLPLVLALAICGGLQPLTPSRAADVKGVRQGDDFVAEIRRSWPAVGLDTLASADFDCAAFQYAVNENSPISRKDIESLVENIKIAWRETGDVNDIIAVSRHLPLSQELMTNQWGSTRSLTRGPFWRFWIDRGVDPATRFIADYCYAFGKEVDHIPACKSVSIYEKLSIFNRHGPKNMILVPTLNDSTVIVRGDPDRDLVTLKTLFLPRTYYEVLQANRSTKLVNWLKTYRANGSLLDYETQLGFSEYTGGDGTKRIFPAITIAARLSPEETVLGLDILVKKNVQFNHPVPDKAFRVAVPKNTWVHLYTGDGPYADEEVGKNYFGKDVEDVLKEGPPIVYRKINAEKRALEKRSADRSGLYWLATGNLIVVGACFVCWLTARRFRR